MVDMRPVVSSLVESIGYDDEAKELHVTFVTTGSTVAYEGVPKEIAESVMNDPVSVGRAVNQRIKAAGYSYRYI